VLNPTRQTQQAVVSVSDQSPTLGAIFWSGKNSSVVNSTVTVPPRDALVIQLVR